jgi:NodT family efflux transporter outer membrane factor (OMF) lipoprotein
MIAAQRDASATDSAALHRFRGRMRQCAVALTALALAACASFDPAPPAEKPLAAAALGARTTAVAWPTDDWWHRYNDPQLDALIADGLAANPTLAAARARIARAEAAAGVARAALLPSVNGNAASLYQRYSENYLYPPPFGGSTKSDNRATLDFSYEFDFWNKHGAALEAALSQAQAASADAQAARVLLTTSTARAYFNLQRLFAQREVSRAAIVQREDVVRLTAQRFSAGLDTRVEMKQAEAALGTVRTELAQYDEAIAIARNQLAALAGAGPERGATIAPVADAHLPAAALPATVPLDLVARRPEIAASRWRIEAAQQIVEVARAEFYPNVNIVAFVGLTSISLTNFFTSGSTIAGVGPAIHLPIFEGGRLNANLRGQLADKDLAVSTYNQAIVDAVRDVADALASIDGLAHVTVEQAKAREATTDAYNLAVVRYKAGLGNYLTVLTAQTQQLVQDRLDADLKARAFELDVNLARALGGGYVDASGIALSAAQPAVSAR